MQNYGMNGYYNPYNQQRFTPLKIYSVSNIMEANATPVENLDPVFFFNRSENIIYKKQIDSTGAAPIQIYKLAEPQHENLNENTQIDVSYYDEKFNALNERLDTLKEIIEKGGKK